MGRRTADKPQMSADAKTEAFPIPRLPSLVVAGAAADVAAPEPVEVACERSVVAGEAADVAAPEPVEVACEESVVAGEAADVAAPEPVEVACEESVQQQYEAGLANLHALHDRWVTEVAELSKAPNTPGTAAA